MDRKNSENGVRIHAKRKRRKATRTKEQMIQERQDKTEKAIELFNTGMDIVDKICKDTPVTDSNGTVEKKNQPVINSIKIEEK